MSTPSQGTSGPSGCIGQQTAPAPLFSGIYAAAQPALTQRSPEQSMGNQIKKLTVRLLPDFFLDIIRAHELLCDQEHRRNVLGAARGMIGIPLSQKKYPSDLLAGLIVCDKRKA